MANSRASFRARTATRAAAPPVDFLAVDRIVLGVWLALLAIGLVAIASASVEYAAEQTGDPFHQVARHVLHILIAGLLALVVYALPVQFWARTGWVWMCAALVLLALVLVPIIGVKSHGARRWLSLGPLTVQVSEFTKLCLVVYLAGYLQRREQQLRGQWQGFLKPMAVVFIIAALLLAEPDYGAAVVLAGTALGMLFLAGANLRHFLSMLLVSGLALTVLLISAPYRMARLAAYRDPWGDPFGDGYQLTQSLIAFGRGEWLGVGLGNSVQKLFYLPEAHTDFVFSIWAEETGLLGALAVIALFLVLVLRVLHLGRLQAARGDRFGAHVCNGVALAVAAQAFINIGVSTGLLPTKGLTLPLVSYGGSSLVVVCCMLALVLRIDREGRREGGRRGR